MVCLNRFDPGQMQQAEQYAADHPDETTCVMVQETGLALATTGRAMQRHHDELRLDDDILSSLEQTARSLKGQKIIVAVPDFKSCTMPMPGMAKSSSSMNGASPR